MVLSAMLTMNNNEIIDVAHQKFATCFNCKKHRKIVAIVNSRYLCINCLNNRKLSCLNCLCEIPYGVGKLCDNCYWTSNFIKKLESNSERFINEFIKGKFEEYAWWLLDKVGPKKASIYVNRHVEFFFKTSALWDHVVPSYSDLLKALRADGLRKYVLVTQWLEDIYQIESNVKQKLEISEIDQIKSLMKKLNSSTNIYESIDMYKNKLLKKIQNNKSSYRSVRLALVPAVHLAISIKSGELPTIYDIKKYLLKHKGQYAALTGYINFIKLHYKLDIDYKSLKIHENKERKRKLLLESRMIEIIKKNSEDLLLDWIRIALIYFHSIEESDVIDIKKEMIHIHSDGLLICILEREYWIPNLPVGGESSNS